MAKNACRRAELADDTGRLQEVDLALVLAQRNLAGDQDGRITEILGLNSVKRLKGGAYSLTEADVKKALKDALSGTDIEAVKRGHESLVAVSQDFAQRLYAQAQANQQAAGGAGAPGGGAEGAGAPNDDEVADAEIVDDEPGEQSA